MSDAEPGGVSYRDNKELPEAGVVRLYRENDWSKLIEQPARLRRALRDSHRVVSAWDGETLVGLGNALSDGFSVVFYSHLLVLPERQGRGIGSTLFEKLR